MWIVISAGIPIEVREREREELPVAAARHVRETRARVATLSQTHSTQIFVGTRSRNNQPIRR